MLLLQRPARFVSTSFRPLLLGVRSSWASAPPPFRSAHIAGLLSISESCPSWRPCSLASLASHRLHPPAPRRPFHRLLVAVVGATDPALSQFSFKIPQTVKYYPDLKFHEVIKVAELPIAAVVRIAKKSGAERVGSDAAAALVAQTEDYIASLVKEANRLAMHAGRKTLKEEDIDLAGKAF
mgnify:CR=1 FL=1